jgi:hypothetical protein
LKNGGVVTISDIVLTDDKLGIITLSDNVTSLDPGQSAGAKASHTVTVGDVLRGTIRNIATATGEEPNGSEVKASSGEVMVSTNALTHLLTKAQILKARGVPGKGIDTAPGLQKPFNPNSRAIDNAGLQKGKGNLEANQNLEQNQGNNKNREKNREQELNGNTLQNWQGTQDVEDEDEDHAQGNGIGHKKNKNK